MQNAIISIPNLAAKVHTGLRPNEFVVVYGERFAFEETVRFCGWPGQGLGWGIKASHRRFAAHRNSAGESVACCLRQPAILSIITVSTCSCENQFRKPGPR